MDVNEFFRQARDYESSGGALDSLFKLVDVLGESHPFPITRMTSLQEWEKGGAYEAILGGEYPKRGAEGERDPRREFERAKTSYAGEFAASEDPLAKAAGRVLDAFGGLFGQGGGGKSPEGEAEDRGPSSPPKSIEDVIDEIFGSRH